MQEVEERIKRIIRAMRRERGWDTDDSKLQTETLLRDPAIVILHLRDRDLLQKSFGWFIDIQEFRERIHEEFEIPILPSLDFLYYKWETLGDVVRYIHDAVRFKDGPSIDLRSLCLEILDLSSLASEREIRTQYRTLAKQTHPDQGGNPHWFRIVKRAYDLLTAES